jgi:hypothetical protein
VAGGCPEGVFKVAKAFAELGEKGCTELKRDTVLLADQGESSNDFPAVARDAFGIE